VIGVTSGVPVFCAGVGADEQAEDFPFVVIREVGMFDQRAPACLHRAQPLDVSIGMPTDRRARPMSRVSLA
jgi:hypothetical protein